MKQLKIDSLSCICNNKRLTTVAEKINSDGDCTLDKLKYYYRCGNKCGKCIPYIKTLIKVKTDF